jgi:RHS repeat-associated protein
VYYEYDGLGQRRNEHTRIFYANGVQVVAPSSRACVWGQTTIALSEPELQLTTAGLRLTLSDYLGSPRVVIDATGLVQERNTYYPSGLQIDALSSTAAGTSDYTAGWANGQRIPAFAAYAGQLHGRRYLDPAISSWYAVEPLATQYAGVSPYNYALGDPVNLSDATGYMPGPEWQLGLDGSNALGWADVIGPGGQPRGLSLWQQRGIYTSGNDFTSLYGYLPIPIFLENTYKIDHYWNNGYINSEGQNVVTSVEYRFTTYGSERVFLGYLSVPVSSLLPNITGKIGIGGSNAPQYSGSGPLSTATAMGPGGATIPYPPSWVGPAIGEAWVVAAAEPTIVGESVMAVVSTGYALWWLAADMDAKMHAYHPAPKTLKAFPDAKKVPAIAPHYRARWKDDNGKIYEWDRQHGKVEVFDKTGKVHQGEFDPDTGEQTKPAEAGRTTNK